MFDSENDEIMSIEGKFKDGKQKILNYIDILLNNLLYNYEEFKTKLQKEKDKINNYSFESIYLECTEIFDMDNIGDDENFFKKKNEELLSQIKNIDKEFEEYSSLLKEELRKYDELNLINPKGLFKNKKIKQKNENIENQKSVIENMLLIDMFK